MMIYFNLPQQYQWTIYTIFAIGAIISLVSMIGKTKTAKHKGLQILSAITGLAAWGYYLSFVMSVSWAYYLSFVMSSDYYEYSITPLDLFFSFMIIPIVLWTTRRTQERAETTLQGDGFMAKGAMGGYLFLLAVLLLFTAVNYISMYSQMHTTIIIDFF